LSTAFIQTDIAFLDQVEELQSAVRVLLGDRDHQPQVGFGHFALGAPRSRLAGRHLAVDFLQFLDRNADARLQVDQLLLLFDNRRSKRASVSLQGRRAGNFARTEPSADCFPCPEIP